MSWFQSANIASLAKSALKEAQKQIDKALEIEEDGSEEGEVEEKEEVSDKGESENQESAWGSFTGSFFELKKPSGHSIAATTEIDAPVLSGDTTRKIDFQRKDFLDDYPAKSKTEEPDLPSEGVDRPSVLPLLLPTPLSPRRDPSSLNASSGSSSILTSSTLTDNSVSSTSETFALIGDTPPTPVALLESADQDVLESVDLGEPVTLGNLEEENNKGPVAETAAAELSELKRSNVEEDERERSPESCEMNDLSGGIRSKGSGEASGHTSGDETTTSSDLEVMGSPIFSQSLVPASSVPSYLPVSFNVLPPSGSLRPPSSDSTGKSHSTRKGNGAGLQHQRTLSDTSSICSVDNPTQELERAYKKLMEMKNLCDNKDTKLLNLSRALAESKEQEAAATTALEENQREWRAERAAWEKQAKAMDTTVAQIKRSCEVRLKEKEDLIVELRAEGEKLSKQQLNQTTIIKKLRNNEKELESQLVERKNCIESQEQTISQLEEQIEALEEKENESGELVHSLYSRIAALEKEVATANSALEDAREEMDVMRASVEASHIEVRQMHKVENESRVSKNAIRSLTEELEQVKAQSAAERSEIEAREMSLRAEVEDLKLRLADAEESKATDAAFQKAEILKLQSCLFASEERNQALISELGAASRPLMKQIESLQAHLRSQQGMAEKHERQLQERIAEFEREVRHCKEEVHVAVDLKEKKEREAEKAREEAEEERALRQKADEERQGLRTELAKIKMEFDQAKVEFASASEQRASELQAVERQLASLRTELTLEREQRRAKEMEETSSMLSADAARTSGVGNRAEDDSMRKEGDSPTPSLAKCFSDTKLSSDAIPTRNPWPSLEFEDSFLETASVTSTSLLTMPNLPTHLDSLQTEVKLRTGEVQQLQSDVSQLRRLRDGMNREVTELTRENEQLQAQLEELVLLRDSFRSLEENYNALLQMFGEKVEENEELKMDLQDIKEAYKLQIDQLTSTAQSSS